MNNILGFLHHLRFCDPQCRFCHCYSKIIHFNSIKMSDGYLNGIEITLYITKSNLPGHYFVSGVHLCLYDSVFKTAQGDICFCRQICPHLPHIDRKQGEHRGYSDFLKILHFPDGCIALTMHHTNSQPTVLPESKLPFLFGYFDFPYPLKTEGGSIPFFNFLRESLLVLPMAFPYHK